MPIISAAATIDGETHIRAPGLGILSGVASISPSASVSPQCLNLAVTAFSVESSASTDFYVDPDFAISASCSVSFVGASIAATAFAIDSYANTVGHPPIPTLVGGLVDSTGLDDNSTLDPFFKNGSVGLRLTA